MELPVYDAEHAAFIWAVYAIGLAFLCVIVGMTLIRASRAKKAMDKLQRTETKEQRQ